MTNDTIKSIATRRSNRAFTSEKIPNEIVKQIADTAVLAPCGMNTQKWHFVVINKQEIVEDLYTMIRAKLGRGDDYNFYGATSLIIAAYDKDNRFGENDCSCALQNMFLAAESLGISSVWINQLKDVQGDSEFDTYMSSLGLPANYKICGTCALGYRAEGATNTPTPKNTSCYSYKLD